jgi:hypothetical protein
VRRARVPGTAIDARDGGVLGVGERARRIVSAEPDERAQAGEI